MSDNVYYYQSIPELGIKGRMDTPKEFDLIGLPKDLAGWQVLDIGCNIGAFLLETKKRGAGVLNGVEPNNDWRWLARGIIEEECWDCEINLKKQLIDFAYESDLVLLLSITHLIDNPQETIDKAWNLTRKLLIIEVNDRLQTIPIKLPEGAKLYGKNKDNRSVWHCYRSEDK